MSMKHPRTSPNVDTRERISLRRIVITLLMTWLSTIGIIIAFVAYLFSTRLLLTRNGIYSSAPAGRLLLIPNIASRAVLLITPVFMTLMAFKLGAEWLRSSESMMTHSEKNGEQRVEVDQTVDAQPSAVQFTHLVNVCSTASPKSVFLAARYLYTSPSSNLHAGLLRTAIRTLAPLLVLAYSLSAVEGIWLHAATRPILLPLSKHRLPTKNLQLSRSIDNSCKQNPVNADCSGEQTLGCSLRYVGNSCSDLQGDVYILRNSDEAILTANNLSTTNVVKFTPDTFSPPPSSSLSSSTTPSSATALLLPYITDEVQARLSYTALTTGVRATCENITPTCNIVVAQPNDSRGVKAGSVLYSGCPGKPGVTQDIGVGNIALGPNASWNMSEFDPTGVKMVMLGQRANPFPLALAMIFNADISNETSSTTPQLFGGMMHTQGPRLFGLLWCQVEVLAPVKYRNDRGNIEVLEEEKADEGSAEVWAISGAFNSATLAAKIYTIGQASPLTPTSNRSIAVTASYSRSVAQVLLSTTAGIHDATASVQETDIIPTQATYVPWAPFAIFAVLVVAYAVFAACVCMDVWLGARVTEIANVEGAPRDSLKVAASRFADPGKVVFDLVGSTRGVVTEETTDVRLRLGRRRDGGFGVHV